MTGADLREFRKTMFLSQGELATTMDVGQTTIARWEKENVILAPAIAYLLSSQKRFREFYLWRIRHDVVPTNPSV
jgi:DNA-binding XRE family transcriptional regulator